MRYLLAVFCALAIVVTQLLYGGAMRPVFALPGLFLVALAGGLGVAAVFWKNVPPPSGWCLASVLAFAGWLIWREQDSPDAWLAAGYLRLTLGCLVIYLLFACVLTNPFHRLAFLVVLFLVAMVQAVTAGLQFARPQTGSLIPWLSEQLRIWYEPRWNQRGHGSYLNANHLAWFLNVTGFFALAVTCWSRWGVKGKILCLYVALVSFAGVMVTLSRGGWLAFGAGMIVFLLLSACILAFGARIQRVLALFALSAAVLLAIGVMFFLFQSSWVVQQRYEELVNDKYRPAVFEAALRQAQIDPLLGTGAGTFMYFGRRYREMAAFSDDVYAHNDWMQLLGDLGLPALLLLVAATILHAAHGLRGLGEILRRRMTAYERPQSHALALTVGGICCLTVFVVHSFLDFNMQIPANALLASACLGMLANTGSSSSQETGRLHSWMRRGGCVVGLGGAVWLGGLTVEASIPEFRWLQAENAALKGRLEEARLHAVEGLKSGPHGRLQQCLGEVYFSAALGAGNMIERKKWISLSIKHLEIAAELNPLDSQVRQRLAEARKVQGRNRSAQQDALLAVTLSPMQGRGYEVYGELLEESGRLAEARQAYLLAWRLPGNLHARKSAAALARKILILSP
jgi:Lipid A core - O-antigen ligase and related enzymes